MHIDVVHYLLVKLQLTPFNLTCSQLKFSTANHPQIDGQTERVNVVLEYFVTKQLRSFKDYLVFRIKEYHFLSILFFIIQLLQKYREMRIQIIVFLIKDSRQCH